MNIHFKSFAAGVILATIGITSIFAAGSIKSAEFNSNKVIFDGTEIDMQGQQMMSVVKEGDSTFSNYMPVRGILEAMGYQVDWDSQKHAVIISSKDGDKLNDLNTVQKDVPEAAVLTKELLNGCWTALITQNNDDNIIDETTIKYYFDSSGNVALFAETEYGRGFAKGTYTIEDDSLLLKYTYIIQLDGNIETYPDNEAIELTVPCRVSADSARMYTNHYDYNDIPLTFVKDDGLELKDFLATFN